MYAFLHQLLSDKEDGQVFSCFGFWHFFYIILALVLISGAVYFLRNKGESTKEKVLKTFIGIAFGLYMADFFLMPFAYGKIDIDKLPFHSCTSMSIMCFLSNHSNFLKKYRLNFALLGAISNLMYICYPAGIVGYAPISYRAIQTLLFHTMMFVYGFTTVIVEREKLDIKRSYRDVVILIILTLWAIIGNTLYSGSADGYSHDFNWFFIKTDPFGGILPENIAPYLLPVVNLIAFFGVEIIVYLIFIAIRKKKDN